MSAEAFQFAEPTTVKKLTGLTGPRESSTLRLALTNWDGLRNRWRNDWYPLGLEKTPLHIGHRSNPSGNKEYIAFWDRSLNIPDVAHLMHKLAPIKFNNDDYHQLAADWYILDRTRREGDLLDFHQGAPKETIDPDDQRVINAWKLAVPHMSAIYQDMKLLKARGSFLYSPHIKPVDGSLVGEKLAGFTRTWSSYIGDPFWSIPSGYYGVIEPYIAKAPVKFHGLGHNHKFEPNQLNSLFQTFSAEDRQQIIDEIANLVGRTNFVISHDDPLDVYRDHYDDLEIGIKNLGRGLFELKVGDVQTEQVRIMQDKKNGFARDTLQELPKSVRSNMVWYPTLRWTEGVEGTEFSLEPLDEVAAGQITDRMCQRPHPDLAFDTIRFNPWLGYLALASLDPVMTANYQGRERHRGKWQNMGVAQVGTQALMYQEDARTSEFFSIAETLASQVRHLARLSNPTN